MRCLYTVYKLGSYCGTYKGEEKKERRGESRAVVRDIILVEVNILTASVV
jgi:hypothetical protein